MGQQLVVFDRFPLQQALLKAKAAVQGLQQRIKLNEFNDIEQSLRIELVATVAAARDVLKAADAQVDAEQARAIRASKAYQRIKQLNARGVAAEGDLDNALMLAETTTIGLREQKLMREAYKTLFMAIQLGPKYIDDWLKRKRIEKQQLINQLAQAKARLALAEYQLQLADIRAPINGVVLQRLQQGGGPLATGQVLLNLGKLEDMQVVAEVLTQDALKLSKGTVVELSASGLDKAIAAQVLRIEPAGFTKLSSLGVEQQRVKVIIAFATKPEGIGVGYRLMARFITAQKQQTNVIPRFSVLEAVDRSHYVLKVVAGKLVQQVVTLGMKNDLKVELKSGLENNEQIIAAPSADMLEGMAVKAIQY